MAFLHGGQETHPTDVPLAELAGRGNVSSSTSGRKKAVYGLSQGCCKGSRDKQTSVRRSALGHFYPALCLSSARCEGAAVRELKATA